MKKSIYNLLAGENLSSRDKLAIARTVLANERTFLAYLRTALAFFIAGASLIKFFHKLIYGIFGWFFLLVGIVCVIIGFKQFKKMAKAAYPQKEEEP